MTFTPEEISTTLISLDRQNKRLHIIVAALLRALTEPIQEQVLLDLRDVDPQISADALEAQYDACALVEQILSSLAPPSDNQVLPVNPDDKSKIDS